MIKIFNTKRNRKNNDKNNKIREQIIYKIIKGEIINNPISSLLLNILNDIIKEKINSVEHKGGRKFNYDFLINNKFKIEFKFNSTRIDKCPQFLSISANNFIIGTCYAEYFYKKYLKDILKLINLKMPNKNEYLNCVYNNDYTKLECFTYLKKNEALIKEQKNSIVKESIKNYLNIVKIDITKLNNELAIKEQNKFYILFKNGKFYKDFIHPKELIITSLKEIKNDNTLIFYTKTNTIISLLLRWKNHNGILYPAWQITLSR